MVLKRKTPLRAKARPKSKYEVSEISTSKYVTDKKKHINELDTVFQFYVRLRDSLSSGVCCCISCGNYVPFAKIQAGHFRSRKNMSTRWNEDNVNGECAVCNLEMRDGDHLLDYRIHLIEKIGEAKVRWLESYSKVPYKWDDFELVIKIKEYCKKCQELSKEKGIPLSQAVQRVINRYKDEI